MSETIVTKFQLDVDDLNAQAKKAGDAVKDVGNKSKEAATAGQKMGGDIAKSLATAQKASKELEKTIREQEKLTNEWRKELVQLQLQQEKVGKGTAEYLKIEKAQKQLNRAIKENVQDIKGLRLQKQDVDSNIRDLKAQEQQFKKNEKAIKQNEKASVSFSDRASRAFKRLGAVIATTFAITSIISFFRQSIQTIADYQAAVSTLGAITNATDKEVATLTKTARSLASASRFTATEVVKAQTELAKLGRTVEEINATTESVLLLATAAGSDVPQAAEVAAQVMNQFGIESAKAGEVTDILAKSFVSSALTLDRFQGAFKAVGTTASVVGASLEQTTANISALVDAGIPAEKAGTDLRNIYIDLANNGLTWNQAQELLLNSSNRLSTATELFGERSGAAGIILAQQADKVARLTGSYENAAGAAEELAKRQLDNLSGDRLLLTSAWEEFILTVESSTNAVGGFGRALTQSATVFVQELSAIGNERLTLINETRRAEERLQELYDEGLNREEDFLVKQQLRIIANNKLRLEELKYLELSVEASDDLQAKEELNNKFLQKRIEDLQGRQVILEKEKATQDELVDIDVRILFLKGRINAADREALINLSGNLKERKALLEQIKAENEEAGKAKQLTEEELEAARKLAQQKIALRLLEAERNNAIINDQLNFQINAIQASLDAAEAADSQNIRNKTALNEELIRLNNDLLRSDLTLAKAREEAKQEEIRILQAIANKTPEIRAQILQAQTDLVGLSAAVDNIFIQLATGNTNFAINPNLAEDIDFSAGITEQLEVIEEATLGMNDRLLTSYDELAKRAIEIYENQIGKKISLDEAYEIASRESEARIFATRAASAAATLQAAGTVFSAINGLLGDQAENSKELALFEIATNTAAGIAAAVSAGAGVAPPGNIAAIAAGIAAVFAGVAQARQVLSSSSQPNFSTPSFDGGGATTKRTRSGGVDGKGGFNAILHPREVVVDLTKPDEGLRALFADPQMKGIISRWSFGDRVNHIRANGGSINAELNDGRIVGELRRNTKLTKQQLEEMRKKGKFARYKRAG